MYNLLLEYIENYFEDISVINEDFCKYSCNKCKEKTIYYCIIDSLEYGKHV